MVVEQQRVLGLRTRHGSTVTPLCLATDNPSFVQSLAMDR